MKVFGKKFVQNIKINLFIFVFGFLMNCQYFHKKGEQQPVAKVYETILYPKDIPNEVYRGKTKEDSINAVHQYIEEWAYQTILINKAKKNVDTIKINKAVKKYNEDLLIETYKNLLLQKYIDTVIHPDTLKFYYEKYQFYFKAEKNMVAAKYLVIPKNNPKNEKIKKWFYSDKPKYQDSLMSNSILFKRWDLSGTKWFEMEDFKNEFPVLKRVSSKNILKKRKKFVLKDSLSLYLIFITDFVSKNNTLPLEFIKNDLKQLILSKRKQQAVSVMEKELKQEAVKRKKFIIYQKNVTKND